MNRCFNCGSELRWKTDIDIEEPAYGKEGIVPLWVCQECGAEHEVFVPFEKPKDL